MPQGQGRSTRANPQAPAGENTLQVPLKNGSVRFAVIGDKGDGSREEYQIGELMASVHDRFSFDFVIMLGDNIHGSERPQDFIKNVKLFDQVFEADWALTDLDTAARKEKKKEEAAEAGKEKEKAGPELAAAAR